MHDDELPQQLEQSLREELVVGTVVVTEIMQVLILTEWKLKYSAAEDEDCYECRALFMRPGSSAIKPYTLMFNERGEVCEGFSTAVYVLFPEVSK